MENNVFEAGIIGAGFSGIGAAIKLKEAGFKSFIVFERAESLGGTWRDNIYPGCGCDVPSHLYSYSFEKNPNWSHLFSKQEEILDYLKKCSIKYNVENDIVYNTEILKAEFDEKMGYWLLTDNHSKEYKARSIIAALGPLNVPNVPKIKGIDKFKGSVFHSSEWDYSFDITNKNVVVIGTGASAIQFVPEIADQVKQLCVFQRTAPWVVAKPDFAFPSWFKKGLATIPFVEYLLRELIYWLAELRGKGFFGNETIYNYLEKDARKHIIRSIKDEALRKAVTPNYKIGCKRVLPSNDYYPALEKDNVELVTAQIDQVTANSVIDKNGVERQADLIIYATGFVASEFERAVSVKGLGGIDLEATWAAEGPEAFKGVNINGFPNFHLLVGPNTGLGHNSIIHIIESQLNYVVDYMKLLETVPTTTYFNVKESVQNAYNETLQERLKSTVWNSGGCKSWYLTSNGKNTSLWPGHTTEYRRITKQINIKDYAVVSATK